MKVRNREINIFNLSMLDVICGALGAFLILLILTLPYYKKTNAGQKSDTDCQATIERLQQELQKTQTPNLDQQTKKDEERLGFALQSKQVVFVLDISRSMGPPALELPDSENSIEQVVAGIKMLVANMGPDYKMDIVFFPNVPENKYYGFMWGELRSVTEDRKYEIYRFLASLEPNGGTPTEAALRFVLENTKYASAGLVMLLTDGVPINQNGFLSAAELEQLAATVSALNNGRKIINTIGVGKDFRKPNSTADAVRFLQMLAKRNGGFYVGF